MSKSKYIKNGKVVDIDGTQFEVYVLADKPGRGRPTHFVKKGGKYVQSKGIADGKAYDPAEATADAETAETAETVEA